MNQKLRFLMLALLCAMFNFAWGDSSVTFDATTDEGEGSITKDGITVSMSTMNRTQKDNYRCNANSNMEVTPSEGIILQEIKITCTASGTNNNGPGKFTLSSDDGEYSYEDKEGTWTGNTSETVTLFASAQVRITQIVVTYDVNSNLVAKPTFSLDEGTYAGKQTVTITAGEGTTIYYTTDETNPTTNSTTYTAPIIIEETTTLKAIAVKGTNESAITEATYTIVPAIPGYVIDFENEVASYTDWVFTNMTSKGTHTNIESAHGGNYFGTTGGKETASITTKEPIATPQFLTCYVSKQSGSTAVSAWIIQVSEDGTAWTDVVTQDATSMAQGTWKEFTADLTDYTDVYVRVYYSGSTAVRNIDDLKLVTTPPAVAKPTITPESGSYASDQEVTIKCETVGATIYYTLDGTDPTNESTEYEGPFAVTESTVIKAIAYNGTDFSDITTVELTLPFANLAALVENMTNTETENYVKLTDALVTYKKGKNAYMEDATAGIYVYGCADNLSVGDKINGVATVKSKTYNNLPEITAITTLPDGISNNNEVTPTELTIEELLANYNSYLSCYVVIKGAEVTSAFDNRNSEIKQGESTINLRDQNSTATLTTTKGMYVKVTGHPAIFNTGKQFSLWEQSQIVEMFKLPISEKASDGTSFFATMANIGEGNFIVPDGVSVSIVEVNNKGKIDRHELFEAGSVIPGNEAYLVEAKASGIYLFDPTDREAVEIPTGNMLYPTIPGQPTTGPDEAKSYVFYKLSLDKNGTKNSVGFYYGAANGAAFDGITANSAYLAVPSDLVQNTNAILINPDDDADGIQGISTSELKNAEVYTLTGVRVQGNLQKGIYIVNGRKQVIK